MAKIPNLPKGGENLSARQKYNLAKKAIRADKYTAKQNRLIANSRADAVKSAMGSIAGSVATTVTANAAARTRQAQLNAQSLEAYKAIINGGAGTSNTTGSITEVGGDGADATKNNSGSAINKP